MLDTVLPATTTDACERGHPRCVGQGLALVDTAVFVCLEGGYRGVFDGGVKDEAAVVEGLLDGDTAPVDGDAVAGSSTRRLAEQLSTWSFPGRRNLGPHSQALQPVRTQNEVTTKIYKQYYKREEKNNHNSNSNIESSKKLICHKARHTNNHHKYETHNK